MKRQNDDSDLEKQYPLKQSIAKLRRLADALETGRRFSIQIAGRRLSVPADATINIEYESDDDEEEIEFQVKWKRK